MFQIPSNDYHNHRKKHCNKTDENSFLSFLEPTVRKNIDRHLVHELENP